MSEPNVAPCVPQSVICQVEKQIAAARANAEGLGLRVVTTADTSPLVRAVFMFVCGCERE